MSELFARNKLRHMDSVSCSRSSLASIVKTGAQIALNWLLQRPTVSSVIVGPRNEEQPRQNLGAVGWSLTHDQVVKLDEASAVTEPYPHFSYRGQEGIARLNPPTAGQGIMARLAFRPRAFDAGDSQHFPGQKLDQQPHPRDASPFRHDEHVERHGWRRIVRQYRFEPPFGKQIVDQPNMRRTDAAISKECFPCGKPVIDPKASTEQHGMGFAVRPGQHQGVTTDDVGHADTVETRQFFGRRRPSMPLQIIGRTDEDAPALPERPQFHGTVGERSEANGDVHALPHQVNALVGQVKIDANRGIAILKGEDQPGDVTDAKRRRAGQAHGAGGAFARVARFAAGLFDQTQDLDGVGIVTTAFMGKVYAPRGSAEQGHAKRLFQLAYMARDAGLADVHLARHGREIPAFGHADECTHTFQSDVRLIHFTALSYPYSIYTGLIVRRLVCGVTVSSKQVFAMNVLIVFAHPEPRSLNAALRDVAVEELKTQGHTVEISDLYAMNWKTEVDRADFPGLDADERLKAAAASDAAFKAGALTEDVKAEQEKLLRADVLILQFPLWWFTMPAILKGWVDRVYTSGFAHGVGEHSETHWGDRYGEGRLAGKRAMLIVTTGGWESHYAPRGVNGPIDDILFPINHGVLHYPGYEVLPSFVSYKSDRLDAAGFELAADRLRERLRTLETTPPIPFRRQNGGDYLIPSLELRPELEPASVAGFSLHLKREG